jgi:YD repeat-containing protein
MKKAIILFFSLYAFGAIKSQSVNEFNGSFNYGIPLLNIPSNRGSGIAIEASYQAGIQVNQSASEVGLGWSINTNAAIYRNVVGFPDDVKNFAYESLPGTKSGIGQGALYPHYPSSGSPTVATDFDLISSNKGLDTSEFTFPGFDSYQVSGPAFSGVIKLGYYKYYKYVVQNISGNSTPEYKIQPPTPMAGGYGFPGAGYYRKPQFHFVGDFADTLVSRYYPNNINSSTPFNLPTDPMNGNGYSNSTEPFVGLHQNGTNYTNQNFDINTGRLATSNFVEYFTNKEIDDAASFSFSPTYITNNAPGLANFIDFQTSHARSSSTYPIYPPDGIGYIKITASNGLIYHYSLPVYQKETTEYSMPLGNDYSVPSVASPTIYTSYIYDNYPNNTDIKIKSKSTNKFAIKWLLTGITGPDYIDVNNNHIIDVSDEGYWVIYDYKKLHEDFIQRIPQYGFEIDYARHEESAKLPIYFPQLSTITANWNKFSGMFGKVNVIVSEDYCLNKIQTSSHTAVFVREVRNDEKGGEQTVSAVSNFLPQASLKLKRILLFTNQNLAQILNNYPVGSINSSVLNSNFFSTQIFNEAWYQQNHSNWDQHILKNVEFDQDYTLAKKYHGNVFVQANNTSVLSSQTTVNSNLTTSNYNQSGKLTLNRILFYELNNVKITPSIVFYYPTSAFGNPDYNPLKSDYWGYYKFDGTPQGLSRYTNYLSKEYTNAWSLFKIKDIFGKITEIEYESNSYNKVIDNESQNGLRGAGYIYRIQNMTSAYCGFTCTLDEGYNSLSNLTDFTYLSGLNLQGLSKKICIPFSQAVCNNNANCINSNYFSGFSFGNCTYTFPSSNSNIIDGTFNCSSVQNYVADSYARKLRTNIYGNYSINNPVQYYNTTWDATYSGNGFIQIECPIGFEVFGAGIRVRRIKSYNSNSEIYVNEYTYEDGVATNEADRYSFQHSKPICATCSTQFTYLKPKTHEFLEMAPMIGYTKVTVKNLGRINQSEGKIVREFLTTPNYGGGIFNQNYSMTTVFNSNYIGQTKEYKTIIECTNKFASAFGAIISSKVFDKNNIQLKKTIFEYEPTLQGALTENFIIEDFYFTDHFNSGAFGTGNNARSFTICILRDIPLVQKSETNYGINTYLKTETLLRDELTGEGVSLRSTGLNNSSSTSFNVPAYKFYHNLDNTDFTKANSRQIFALSQNLFSYNSIDTTLNGSSFLNATYQTYTKSGRKHLYNSITSNYTNSNFTLPYYFRNRTFAFDAGKFSMNNYGLFDKSHLAANQLNLTTLSNTNFWEPGTSSYNWKMVSEITLFDKYNHSIEDRDANSKFSACRYGYDGYYKIANANNCNHASFTYSGFEESNSSGNTGNGEYEGDLKVNNHAIQNFAHTGLHSVEISSTPIEFIAKTQLSPGGSFEIGLMTDRIYRASVWVHSPNNLSNAELKVSVIGFINNSFYSQQYIANTTNNLVTTIANWNLIQIDFKIPKDFTTGGNEVKIQLKSNGGNVYFDDFILHPVESDFSAQVYNSQTGRVTSSIDENGFATNYTYNAAGQVIEIWKEIPSIGYKKVKSYAYNYARGAND